MNKREQKRADAIRKAEAFCDANKAAFQNTPVKNGDVKFQAKHAELKQIEARIGKLAATQAGGDFHAGTTRKATERNALLLDLRELRDDVETIADDLDRPELADRFTLPRSNNDVLLVTAANAFITAVEELELQDELIALGHENDFLDDLREQIGAFETADDEQGTALGGQTGATDALGDAIRGGLACVRTLDRIIRKRFRGDAEKIGAWETASHVERAARGKKAAGGGTSGAANGDAAGS